MSQGFACRDTTHKARWVVIHRRCNFSAFNGYRWTPSDYSLVGCTACGALWRTKAKFTDDLPSGDMDAVSAGRHGTN